MRNFIKKLRCDHVYYKVGKRRKPNSLYYYVVLYCPRCNKQKYTHEESYEVELQKRKIDKQFKEEN